MEFPKILLKSLLAVGSVGAATWAGVGLGGLMEKKTDSQGGEVEREKIPSKKELTEEQNGVVSGTNIPNDCKYLDEACNVTIEKLKLINFSNKQNGNPLTVTPDNVGVSLTMENLSDKEKTAFNNKSIKFNFKVSNSNLEIKNGDNDSNKISLLKNTNYEFKKNDQGKLERAWGDGEVIGKKIGLGSLAYSTTTFPKSFSLAAAKLNIFFENKLHKQLTPVSGHRSFNLQLEENKEGYNNGFKYSTPSEIQFENQTVKLEANKGYEIKFIEDDWYLSKVESVSGGRQ